MQSARGLALSAGRVTRFAAAPCARMPARNIQKSKAIEEWAAMRENTTSAFTMTRRNFALSVMFFGVVPFGLMKFALAEQHKRDAENGLPPRKYITEA